jgi:hypothetical protein
MAEDPFIFRAPDGDMDVLLAPIVKKLKRAIELIGCDIEHADLQRAQQMVLIATREFGGALAQHSGLSDPEREDALKILRSAGDDLKELRGLLEPPKPPRPGGGLF